MATEKRPPIADLRLPKEQGVQETPIVMPVEFSVQAYCLRCKTTADVTIRTISDLAVFEIVPPSGWRVIFDDSAAVRFFLLCDCDRKEPQ
jgi:hypothetical protein